MKILLTGVSGLTGRYVINHALRPATFEIFGTSQRLHQHADFKALRAYEPVPFENKQRYLEIIRDFKPDVIANLGGEGNVDLVQKDPDQYLVTNYDFPIFLLEESARRKIKIVQFSSNAVYDGKSAPYGETAPLSPLNLYGALKKRVDLATRSFAGEWLIVRPIITYGWNYSFGRGNPVSQFVPLLRQGKPIKMVTDQFENPIYAGDVAGVFWRCLLDGVTGEFNLAGGDDGVSRYEWLHTVADVFRLNSDLIQKVSVSDFTFLAPRPKDTRFDIARLVRDLKYRPIGIRDGALVMRDDAGKRPAEEN